MPAAVTGPIEASADSGSHRLTSRLSPSIRSSSTPITVKCLPFTVTVWPTTPGSPAR